MSETIMDGDLAAVASPKPHLDEKPHAGGAVIFLGVLLAGLVYAAFSISSDIAAAGEKQANSIISELRSYKDEVNVTLSVMEKLNPDFVSRAIAELAIKPKYEGVAKSAMERARETLLAV